MDGTQELNSSRSDCQAGIPGICRAHEFIPVRDPLKSLAEAVNLCDV